MRFEFNIYIRLPTFVDDARQPLYTLLAYCLSVFVHVLGRRICSIGAGVCGGLHRQERSMVVVVGCWMLVVGCWLVVG